MIALSLAAGSNLVIKTLALDLRLGEGMMEIRSGHFERDARPPRSEGSLPPSARF